jgi:hypothetical protein
MRTAHALSLVVLAAFLGPAADDVRAQAARRGPYYSRTTTTRGREGMALERGFGSLQPTSAASAENDGLLRPYSSQPSAGATRYSSEPPVVPPPMPRPQRPVSRNYFPNARTGQSVNLNTGGGRRHCTPSRAGTFGR